MVDCFLEGAISGVTLMVNGIAAEDGARRAKEARMSTGLTSTSGNPTYTPSNLTKDEILQNHLSVLNTSNIPKNQDQFKLPYLYWIPKLHRNPYKQRYIAGSSMHLNVTEGIPVGTKRTTLTDNEGHFLGKLGFRKAMANGEIDLEDFRKEMQSQIDRFESLMGKKPTHIDGHQHAHLIPGVCEVFGSLLQENGVRSTRCPYEDLGNNHMYSWTGNNVDDSQSFYRQVVQDATRAKNIMKETNIWVSGRFVGLQTMGSDMTLESLQRQIAKVYGPPGNDVITCELMVHPGYRTGTEGGCGQGPDDFSMSADREHEMSILLSREMLEFYRKQEIEIVSFEQCYNL